MNLIFLFYFRSSSVVNKRVINSHIANNTKTKEKQITNEV